MMITLAVILIIISLLFAYLLFVPMALHLHYIIGDKTSKTSIIKLYPFEYRFKSGKSRKNLPAKISVAKDDKTKPGKRKLNFVKLVRAESQTFKLLFINGAKLFYGLLKAPKIKRLNVSLSGGLAGPDMTGMLYGGVMAIKPMLRQPIAIAYNPDFGVDRLAGDLNIEVVVRLYKIVKELLLFIWRMPKLRLIKIFFKLRKGGEYAQ